MPLAMRKNTNTPQSAVLKPCVRPYHGTRITAAAAVSANISALVQTIGACGSVVGWAMRCAGPRAVRAAQAWRLRRGSKERRNLARLGRDVWGLAPSVRRAATP